MSPGEWNAGGKKRRLHFAIIIKKEAILFFNLLITNEKIFFFWGSLTLSSCLDEGVGRK